MTSPRCWAADTRGRGCRSMKLSAAGDPGTIALRARFPGAAGRMRVRLTAALGQNVLGAVNGRTTIGAVQDGDIVWVTDRTNAAASRAGPYRVQEFFDVQEGENSVRFSDLSTPTPTILTLRGGSPPDLIPGTHRVQVVTLTVTAFADDPDALSAVWADLPLEPNHERFGVRDSFSELFAATPATLAAGALPADRRPARRRPADRTGGARCPQRVLRWCDRDRAQRPGFARSPIGRSICFWMAATTATGRGRPNTEGEAPLDSTMTRGLRSLELLEDISIVAAPGSTFQRPNDTSVRNGCRGEPEPADQSRHADEVSHRGARFEQRADDPGRARHAREDRLEIRGVLLPMGADSRPDHRQGSRYAAERVRRRHLRAQRHQSRRVQGTRQRGRQPRHRLRAHRSTRRSRTSSIPKASTASASSKGAAIRLWGARTISSDPEWKYVNLRRYFIYLEHSIDKGTQWAVFEPNGELLWANVRRTIEDFLLNEWQMGALLGDKPEKAFFVRCDRIDHDAERSRQRTPRLPDRRRAARPAEFVIFRIGQWTADRRI